MQKVITVTTRFINMGNKEGESFSETEYTQVSKLLSEGYKVVSVTPAVNRTSLYSLTFVLEK